MNSVTQISTKHLVMLAAVVVFVFYVAKISIATAVNAPDQSQLVQLQNQHSAQAPARQ